MTALAGLTAGINVTAMLRALAGPVPAATAAIARAAIPAFNDVTVSRRCEYYLNSRAVANPRDLKGYVNLVPSPESLIRIAHSQSPDAAGGGGVIAGTAWSSLADSMKNHGIDIGGGVAAAGDRNVGDWVALVNMAATAAPLQNYVADYYRTSRNPGNPDAAAAGRIDWAFRRGGYSMQDDRDIILRPWHQWGLGELNHLSWLGIISDAERERILASSGYARPDDAKLADALKIVLPSPGELLAWGGSGKLDDGLAARYGLDAVADSAVFWAKAQGYGADAPAIPNAPAGLANWTTIAARAAKRLPGLGECLEMQRRFRALPANPAVAMDGRSPVWTEQNTRDMLRLQGVPDPVANSLVALVTEPLNVRIVNEVLLEALKHPPVAALAANAAAPGVDWVAEAYLSHGVSDEWAATAAAAIRAKADDAYNAEKIEGKRKLREEKRRVWLERYRLGNASPGDAAAGVQDEFFDAGMAADAMFIVDSEVGMSLIKSQLDSLKKMYLSGGIAGPQLNNQIQSLGVDSFRAAWYVQEWTWERLEGTRFASTGDILAAFKRGLLTEAGALTRLQNLGWSNADALLQVAVVEHDAAAAHAAELAREQAKAAVDVQKQLRERQKALADKQKLVIETTKAQQKLSLEQTLAAHEMLAARDKYYRAVHLQNDAYAAAEKKDDKEKMAAILAAELQEYQDYLIEQTKIFHSLTGGVPSGNQIDAAQASGPDKSAVGPTGPAQPGGAPGGDTGGTATGGASAGP